VSTQIKICGITTVGDALAAIEAGANFLGLIFAEKSARKVDETDARAIMDIVRNHPVKVVGVFKDQDLAYVSRLAMTLKLDYVQCHGGETLQYAKDLPTNIIRVIEIDPETFDAAKLAETLSVWRETTTYFLFDRPKGLNDPAWLPATLEKMVQVSQLSQVPYFLAGGLGDDNVGQAIAALNPYGVDVASSIEAIPGKKDLKKMAAFCLAVSQASEGVSTCAH
jgi:phosphoribosylanthranilate isomerase